jgi:hypothetical protein
VLAILILRKVSICVNILMVSVSEKGSPRHFDGDSLPYPSLNIVRLK